MEMYPKNIDKELKTQEWKNVINQIPQDKGKVCVTFFGGEPLLRNDLPDLISFANKKNFATSLFTNGLLLTEKYVRTLKNAGLDLVEISVDSLRPEIHDKLRGVNGTFEKLQMGIKYCLSENLRFAISTYSTKENIKNGDLEEMISWARKIGAFFTRVLAPIPAGKFLQADDVKLGPEEKERLKKIVDQRFSFCNFTKDYCSSKSRKLVYISPHGDLQPCQYVPLSFGNIREEPLELLLKKMWEHPVYKTRNRICFMRDHSFQNKYIKNIKNTQKFPIDLS